MSATISAVLPTLAAELTANVATLSAKENTFAGKLGAAQAAYQNSDDAGSQSVGQIVGMLGQAGQMGQMGQSMGAPMQALGGQTGMFGSLMQQAMQGGHGGGQSAAGPTSPAGGAAPSSAAPGSAPSGAAPGSTPGGAAGGAAAGSVGATPGQHPAREGGQPVETSPTHRDEREPLHRADDGTQGAGPAPVAPPGRHSGDDDIARNL